MPRYNNFKVHGNKVFKLMAVTDEGWHMEHHPFFDPIEKVTIDLSDLRGWKQYKGIEPQMCSDEQCWQWLVHKSSVLEEEMVKANVQQTVLQLCAHNGVEKGALGFSLGPTGVWCKKNLKKSQLKLFPGGTLTKIKDIRKCKARAVVSASGCQFAVSPFKSNREFENDKGVLDAFFWIKSTEDLDAVNMQLKEHIEGNVTVPFLTNTRPLKRGEPLLQMSSKAESGDGEAAPAAKKPKK